MSFEFTGLTYDPGRKVTTTQKIVVQNPDSDTPDEKKVYMPVPYNCLLYTSPSPRDKRQSRMPSSA